MFISDKKVHNVYIKYKNEKSTIYKIQLKQLWGTSKRINKWVIKINKNEMKKIE